MSRKNTCSTPEGLKLRGGFVVGPQIGEGAQAVVHALLLEGRSKRPTDKVVKLAKCPDSSLSKSQAKQMNLSLITLKGEGRRYSSHFRQGNFTPNVELSDLSVFSGTTAGTSHMHAFIHTYIQHIHMAKQHVATF